MSRQRNHILSLPLDHSFARAWFAQFQKNCPAENAASLSCQHKYDDKKVTNKIFYFIFIFHNLTYFWWSIIHLPASKEMMTNLYLLGCIVIICVFLLACVAWWIFSKCERSKPALPQKSPLEALSRLKKKDTCFDIGFERLGLVLPG